jgi:hypothetical protein
MFNTKKRKIFDKNFNTLESVDISTLKGFLSFCYISGFEGVF